jgi:lysine 2,3-aminomutase
MNDKKMEWVAMLCGGEGKAEPPVEEVLITGGDPLIAPVKVARLVSLILEHAPNVRTIRVGTRVPTQDPARIDDDVLRIFQRDSRVRFEVGVQINHPVELFAEVRAALGRLKAAGVIVYAQNVLLRGVNDDAHTLVELYDTLRALGVESHYLFHAVPLRGTHHLRTTLDEGLSLARALVNGGSVSGRAKPMFTLMTDLGKVTPYEGTIVRRDEFNNMILLRTEYRLDDRLRWNPDWRCPSSVVHQDDGTMDVWYLDGVRDGAAVPAARGG